MPQDLRHGTLSSSLCDFQTHTLKLTPYCTQKETLCCATIFVESEALQT